MATMLPEATPRYVLRAVLAVVAVAFTLYLVYLLQRPLAWLVTAAFIAVAMAAPVRLFSRWMPRGGAIAICYVLLILIPVGLGAVLIPPLVNELEDLAQNVPGYARDVTGFVNENETLRSLDQDYDITTKLEDEAEKLPSKLGDAAGALQDIGVGIVNSIFTAVTILILSMFMVAGGRRWIDGLIRLQRPEHAEWIERTLDRISNAIANYVGGALLQATIAAVAAYVMLTILGAPFRGPLALTIFFFDLIPVVGATIAAVLVGIVLVFVDFPTAVIVWAAYAIVFQQIENYVVQPQIQKRATRVEPFFILVAVLFGTTLFGVPGAILAVPAAASIQIAGREWIAYRREVAGEATATPAAAPSP